MPEPFPWSTPDLKSYLPSYEEALTRTPALMPCLEVAVPLRILQVRHYSFALRKQIASGALETIASHGDDVLFQGAKKGDTAAAFNALALALAICALAPGGITFAGRHWEARQSALTVGASVTEDGDAG